MKKYAIINGASNGSTGKICTGLHDFLLKSGEYSIFFYSRGPQPSLPNSNKIGNRFTILLHAILARITGLQGFFSYFPTKKLIKQLIREKVTNVFAGNLHGYYLNERMLLRFIAEADIKLVYLMFDEYAFLGKCAFTKGCDKFTNECNGCNRKKEYPQSLFFNTAHYISRKKKEVYDLLGDKCVFVAPEFEIELSKKSSLLQGRRTFVADEAIDTNFFSPREVTDLKKELGISDDKFVCVCVALFNNMSHAKGASFFIELAKSLEGNPNYVFVHVGYLLSDKSFLPTNYIPIGFVDSQDKLAGYYSLADLFVLPAVAESMPNSCLEALSCGSPLLCFDYGGMKRIASEDVATFVETKNVKAMKDVVLSSKKKDESIIEKCRNYAIDRYDNQKYFANLLELSNSL